MKKLIYVSLIVVVLSSCASLPNAILPYSQPLDVKVNPINIENTLGSNIDAKEYVFPFEVKSIILDTSEMKAFVSVKNPNENPKKTPGILIYYDLIKNEIIWTKRSNAWDPKFFDDKIIIKGSGKVFALNKKTGDPIWEREGSYFLYDRENMIGYTGSLTAFDLNTGMNKWTRELNHKFGWNENRILDSMLIVAADGLHTFNLKTGQGWDIAMPTGKKDEAATAAKNVGRGVLGALTGVYSYVQANVWSNMTSNLLFDDDKIFFTAKDNFVSVETKTGKEIWRLTLPDKQTAKTIIRDNGDHLVLVNTGSCDKNSAPIEYGEPFIAKYDQKTGEQVFFDFIDSQSPVKDFFISPNGYYIISSETLLHYDTDGNVKAKVKFDKEKAVENYGNFLFFAAEDGFFSDNYVKVGENYEPLSNYFEENLIPLAITNMGIVIFNESFEVEHWFPLEQIYISPFEYPNSNLHRSYVYLKLKPTVELLSQRMKWAKENKTTNKYKKDLQNQYNETTEGNSDYLEYVYVIEGQGEFKGTLHLENSLFEMKGNILYNEGNSLVLISPVSSE